MTRNFLKNFYYNKTSVLKLINLYNFLNKDSFLQELSCRLIQEELITQNSKKTELLLEIYECLLKKHSVIEYSFGFVWFFEGKVVLYFKDDFEFDDFFQFFEKLYENHNIFWHSLEFFDKDVKILEIFRKNSFLRSFREEVLGNDKKKVKSLKKTCVDLTKKEFLFFIQKYESRRMKIVIYFPTA